MLVVDDEAMNRDMLSRRLVREGFAAVPVASGAEALEYMQEHHVDLVLLDVMMPEMSGVEMLTRLREDYSSAVLPVIMVSAASDSAQVVEALNCGANDYVTKPVNMPVLLARVQSQLARRQEAGPFKVVVGGLVGSYKVVSEIGQGGMATVYKAIDTRLKRLVALKVLHAEQAASEEQRERFVREAKSLARVSHPQVAAIYEVASVPCHFIAMELLEWPTLAQCLETSRLSVHTAVDYALQIAEALAAVHAHGILHRDLKPANMVVDSHQRLHIMDFGLAKITTDNDLSLTVPGTILGTPQYMAPEQVDDTIGPVCVQTDLYALGLILHQMLTRNPVLKGTSLHSLLFEIVTRVPERPSVVNPCVPPSVDELCLRLEAPKPEDRFATASEVVSQLQQILLQL